MRRGEGGRLFEAGRLLTFSTFRMGVYSRWVLIRGWALIRINTVPRLAPQHIFESGAYEIIFGTGAALIREAALYRSFTV